jgi:hypothetical protein
MKTFTLDTPTVDTPVTDNPTNHIPAFNPLLTTEQAARFLQVSPSCLERYRSTGDVNIPVVRIGDRLCRYKLADLQRFAEEHTVSRK